MKKSLIAVAVLGALSGAAFAQTNVTLYGKIDESYHHLTNVNAAGQAQTLLDAGAFSGNRWGLKGTEDLGGGMKTVFQLESGYDLNNGKSNQGGRLFGRQAYVGLGGDWGTLTFGRQYALGFQIFGNYDPLGWGNWTSNSFQLNFTGLRADNVAQYSWSGAGFGVTAQYVPGGVAGDNSAGRTTGIGGTYSGSGLTVGAFAQSTNDAATTGNSKGTKDSVQSIGASYNFAPVTVYASYLASKKDAYFGTSAAGANAGLSANADTTAQRKDKIVTVGAAIQTSAAGQVIVGYVDDKITAVTNTTDGKQSTIYAYYDYNLSKRTDVYVGLGSSKVSDGAISHNEVGIGATQTKQSEYGLGVRHVF